MSHVIGQLKDLFKSDHVAFGLVTAYATLLRFTSTIGIVDPSSSASPTATVASRTDAGASKLLTQCHGTEVVLDSIGLIACTIVFLIRHKRQDNKWSTAKLLARTAHFGVYLFCAFNKPLGCAGQAVAIVQSALLMVLFTVPSLLAHTPRAPSTEQVGSVTPSDPEVNMPRVLDVLSDQCDTTHSDVLIVTLYNFIVKLTQSNDPSNCDRARLIVSWTAFALLVVLFKIKHYVQLYHTDDTSCRSIHVRTLPLKPWWWFVANTLRTLALLTLLLCSHTYPLSCGNDARLNAWVQGSFTLVLTAATCLVHATKKPQSASTGTATSHDDAWLCHQ